MPPKQTDAGENAEQTTTTSETPAAADTGAEQAPPAGDPPAAAPVEAADGDAAQAAAPVENPLQDLGQAPIRHPDGATSCSFDGVTYEADATGIIIVPLAAFEVLRDHGFVLATA